METRSQPGHRPGRRCCVLGRTEGGEQRMLGAGGGGHCPGSRCQGGGWAEPLTGRPCPGKGPRLCRCCREMLKCLKDESTGTHLHVNFGKNYFTLETLMRPLLNRKYEVSDKGGDPGRRQRHRRHASHPLPDKHVFSSSIPTDFSLTRLLSTAWSQHTMRVSQRLGLDRAKRCKC